MHTITNLYSEMWKSFSSSSLPPVPTYRSKMFHCLLFKTLLSPSRSFNIPYFRTYRSDRSDSYSRVAILIHNFLKSELIPIETVSRNVFINHTIGIIEIEILTSDSSPLLKIWSCYIPSNSNIPTSL